MNNQQQLREKLGALLLPPKAKKPTKREPRFEVLWYEGETEDEAVQGDYKTREFYTRKQALAFFDSIKLDPGKFYFWVTHRDADWNVIEDIIG